MDPLASNYNSLANVGCCGDWAAGWWMNGNPNGVAGVPYVTGAANDSSWYMDNMIYTATTSSVTDPVTGYVTITSVYDGNLTSCEYTGAATATNVSTHDPALGMSIVGTVSFTITGTGGFSFSSIGTFTGLDASGNLLGTLASSAGSGTNTSCCVYPVPGCTDPTACNYNSAATVDDGSCNLPDGCTDPLATNYNAAALCDDGSCLMAPMVNLFFSEYAEGSSNNKYLEIYNPTLDTVDLSDYAYPNVNGAPAVAGGYDY
jgi:hypothetical protein